MSTVIMEVNTEGFRNVSTQRHENIENGITSPPTSLVFLHAYVAVLVGTLLAIAIAGIWALTISLIHHSQRTHIKSKSRRRLLSILPTLIMLPTGIIIYGWTAEYKAWWAVAMLGIVLVGSSFGGWVSEYAKLLAGC